MTRSRTSTSGSPCSRIIRTTTVTNWTNPSKTDTVTNSITTAGPTASTEYIGTIVDDPVLYKPRVRRRLKKPAYLDKEFGEVYLSRPLPAKPCTHTKTELDLFKPVDLSYVYTDYPGNATWERTVAVNVSAESGRALLAYAYGVPDSYTSFSQLFGTPINSVDSPVTPDWFSLLDAFSEKSEQYIPNQMLLGESIAEGAIYKDALKLVMNPSSAISLLLKNLKDLDGLKKLSLGTLFKKSTRIETRRAAVAVGKDVSSNFLGLNFAVLPVIEDIKATLSAHREVERRLAWLSKHGGGYTKVGVRRRYEIGTSDPPAQNQFYMGTYSQFDHGQFEAGISGMAQIKTDLPGDAGWQAYYQYFGLNKILGLAWELVPFSFVLDWVTNAQECINYYTRLSTGSPYQSISSVCHYTKLLKRCTLRHHDGWNPAWGAFVTGQEGMEIGRGTLHEYTRTVGYPQGAQHFDLSMLGSFHAAATGAMLLQRAPHTWVKPSVSSFVSRRR